MTFDQLQLAAVFLDENPEVPQYIKGSDVALQFFSPENLTPPISQQPHHHVGGAAIA
ncbi:hypothetical protein [Chitinophaga cymbidii]|uniref:hypothetical protein n=1 Tax=Chitinophaga cymbidii TaxID=1096750 RepID=UPI00164AF528|nr:hypothetical protein [Chitinophaga cymbidii]